MKKSIYVFIAFTAMIAFSMSVSAMDDSLKKPKQMYSEGYELNIKYCTSCHNSVADPEKTGYTRDTWYVIINVMHKYGMQTLPQHDADVLVDYFYTIRKGIERDPG